MDRAGTALVVRELLTIAKVAMPPKLFGQDPRVSRGIALMKELEAGLSSSRPPQVTSRPPKLDIAVLASRRAVAETGKGISFVTDLPWDLVEALAEAEGLPLDPAEAVSFIVRDWLTLRDEVLLSAAKDGAN